MPSWNEKPHTTPLINVNLTGCDNRCMPLSGAHREGCTRGPVLIPCPIPRTVTLKVALGECTCFQRNYVGREALGHNSDCPVHPVSVTCTIGGEVWADSAVVDVECEAMHLPQGPRYTAALDACRARWEIVEALMTGFYPTCDNDVPDALMYQRDAMFAHVCGMYRAEVALASHWSYALKALGVKHGLEPLTHSQMLLGDYVKRLVEQVGVLP